MCYAYLSDVEVEKTPVDCTDVPDRFASSRWFTRGWTLQELTAPEDVVFYGRDWKHFGNRNDGLLESVCNITGVDIEVFWYEMASNEWQRRIRRPLAEFTVS